MENNESVNNYSLTGGLLRMDKKEKILAKIGKYLDKLNDEEKNEVIEEIASMKDDEEIVEEKPTENEAGEETEVKEEVVEETEQKEESTENKEDDPAEEEKVEESTEEVKEEESKTEDEVAKEGEEVGQEETPEEKVEEQAQETFDYKGKYEELVKAHEGLVARMEALEQIISQLGTPKEDKSVGLTPKDNSVDESKNSYLEELNRKRMGY